MVGLHALIQGRCEDVLPQLEAESVDVCFTSPPYNLGVAYETYSDDLSEEDYLAWMCRVFAEVARILKPGGSLFLNIGGSSLRPWMPFILPARLRALKRGDGRPLWHLQNTICWVKSIAIDDVSRGHFKPINSPRFVNPLFEPILHLTKSGAVPLDRLAIGVPYADKSNINRFGHTGREDARCRGNVWFVPYPTVQSREQKLNHAASFPVMLPRMAIRLHGVPSPVVLDPFAGVGTTLVAAAEEGGVGVGIEVGPSYLETAAQRLQALLGVSREQVIHLAANLAHESARSEE